MESGGRVSRWLRRSPVRQPEVPPGPLLSAAASAGFPVAPAARPQGYGCSCDRVGCPSPGMHPVSQAWQTEASTDPERLERWLREDPSANFVTATGIRHDVLDVPVPAGALALERWEAGGRVSGPVTRSGDRALFFTATRTPVDEDEWWPCELDCHPETLEDHPGLRWHTRGSYVLLPPSRLPGDAGQVTWIRPPGLPLPDPLVLLDVLADTVPREERA